LRGEFVSRCKDDDPQERNHLFLLEDIPAFLEYDLVGISLEVAQSFGRVHKKEVRHGRLFLRLVATVAVRVAEWVFDTPTPPAGRSVDVYFGCVVVLFPVRLSIVEQG
jgi:hypothetical protein